MSGDMIRDTKTRRQGDKQRKRGARRLLVSRSPYLPVCSHRPASVLLLALVVIVLLTLGAMSFFDRMFVEHQAVRAHIRQTQARFLAESGIEYIRAMAIQDPNTITQSGGVYNNPTLFHAQLL